MLPSTSLASPKIRNKDQLLQRIASVRSSTNLQYHKCSLFRLHHLKLKQCDNQPMLFNCFVEIFAFRKDIQVEKVRFIWDKFQRSRIFFEYLKSRWQSKNLHFQLLVVKLTCNFWESKRLGMSQKTLDCTKFILLSVWSNAGASFFFINIKSNWYFVWPSRLAKLF